MNLFLQGLIAIAIWCVIVTDISDFPETLKMWLSSILTKGKIKTFKYRFHLFDCSFCQVTHLGNLWILIYWLMTGYFSLWSFPLVMLMAVATPLILHTIETIENLYTKLLNLLQK